MRKAEEEETEADRVTYCTEVRSNGSKHLREAIITLSLTLVNQLSVPKYVSEKLCPSCVTISSQGVTALSTFGPRIFEKVGIKDPLRITVGTGMEQKKK